MSGLLGGPKGMLAPLLKLLGGLAPPGPPLPTPMYVLRKKNKTNHHKILAYLEMCCLLLSSLATLKRSLLTKLLPWYSLLLLGLTGGSAAASSDVDETAGTCTGLCCGVRRLTHLMLQKVPIAAKVTAGGGRVVRWCWVNFQCRDVLQFGL